MARKRRRRGTSVHRSRSSKSRQSRTRGPSARQKTSSASRSPCPSRTWWSRTRDARRRAARVRGRSPRPARPTARPGLDVVDVPRGRRCRSAGKSSPPSGPGARRPNPAGRSRRPSGRRSAPRATTRATRRSWLGHLAAAPGGEQEVGQAPVVGQPPHDQHPVDRVTVLVDHVQGAEVDVRREPTVEHELTVDRASATPDRAEVEEPEVDRLA